MDCPHCQTRNPLGAANCSKCRAPLGGSAETLVAEMTPPAGSSAVTLEGAPRTPPDHTSDVTLDGSDASSMAIPTAWSAPVLAQGGGVSVVFTSIQPGSVLGNRYEILSTLGEGGMGAVYKARDRELDRLVALKVIRPELAGRPEILQRFKQELILARKVTHRNVIRIFDLGEAEGTKFITMEFIEGHDLKSVLTGDGKLPSDRAVEIIQQVCLALEAAHAEEVVHRDLKPQNIMLDQQGRALVMDFGIARSLEVGGMTQTGALIGTPEYRSPEQVRGEHVDARSDLFTLGVIFQEILTGMLPYQADTAMASMFKRTRERAVSVRQLDPGVPPYLSDIVAKCLEIEPQDRFQSARELYDALQAWKSGDAAPIRTGRLRWVRRALRNRAALGGAAAAAAVLAVVLTGAVIAWRLKSGVKPAGSHAPVSVLVADFTNHTGDPIFDGTLEPMFNVALEGASFVNAYSRGEARQLAGKLSHPTTTLDEQSARLVAVSQGVNAIVTGSLTSGGGGYQLSVQAVDAVTGKTLAAAGISAANKDDIVLDVPKLVAPLRKAMGDTTPESAQLAAVQGSFTVGNLEAVHQYGIAMERQFAGDMEGALASFAKAVELDSNFARAYSGMAAAYGNLGRPAEAEKYAKLALQHIDRMSERERYRTRGEYYIESGSWQKCIEEYGELGKRYPADNAVHTNLALCYSQLRNWPQAVEEARKDVEIHADVLGVTNLALFSSYAGDFASGEREARRLQQLNPSYEYGQLSLAFAQVGQGRLPEAAATYQKLGSMSAMGASRASSGRADLAVYEGHFADAIGILEKGVAADLAANRRDSAADKLAEMAYTHLLRRDKPAAAAASDRALATSQTVKIRFLAARTFVEVGETAKAQKLAAGLASEILPEPQAYAKIIAGDAALQRGERSEAIKDFTEANSLLDTWIGRFDLGRAYLEAGAFTEADSEFDRCSKRRGEALALFLDEVPTYAFFPPVEYFQGRVREGLKSPGFAEPYQAYLRIRGKSAEDPLIPEIRRRLGQ